jgi:nanoRNase/pAp phosphatase (c-di-AMP/oligoRNAs hydrolase)
MKTNSHHPQDDQVLPVSPQRLAQLRQAAGSGPVLILTHDNPDPDGLASGKALAVLLRQAWGVASRLAYTGLVGRAENKAMLRLLTPEWEQLEDYRDLHDYSALALLDTQPGAGNNSLPAGISPQIVIDHHQPIRQRLLEVPFVDVRTDAGATASLVHQYLEAAGVTPDEKLATAIFYGIQADTLGLSRGSSPIDQDVYFKMLQRIDRQLFAQVEQAGLPLQYFRSVVHGLQSARCYGHMVVSYLGDIHRPDFVAELADLLIRLEGTRAVLCMGYHASILYLSLRTTSEDSDAGLMIQKVILPSGRAGGHGALAGGQVPLAGHSPDEIAQEIQQRFLEVMNASGEAGYQVI